MATKSAFARATSSTVPTPWKHQAQTTKFFSARPRGCDFSDPGTGKTRGQLDRYAARKSPGRLLVLCPKTLMTSAWANDIEAFQPGMTCSLAYADNREEAFKLKTDCVITNIDAVKWLAKNKGVLKDFDDVVIDESTVYKHPTSQRTKAALFLRSFFDHRHIMTGTPNPISVTELWSQMMLVDDGKRLGTSYFKLRQIMQVPTQVGPDPKMLRWDDKPGAAQAVQDLLADITIRHAFEEVMTHVPANHRDTKRFTLNRKTKKIYDQLEADAVTLLGQTVITAVHAASLRQKLLQVASGAVYSENGEYEVIDDQRYELIGDLVEERDHSVVFFNWKHQRDQLCKRFEARHLSFAVIDGDVKDNERDKIVAEYQKGRYDTLLLHPRTGAHGLTLTRGTTTIISSPFYEADLLKQAIHRIYRGGQTEVTNTILVEADNTVEAKVYARLLEKETRMIDLLDLIQAGRRK